MATWSRSALSSPSGLYSPPGLSSPSGLYSPPGLSSPPGHKLPSIIVTDKSFPTLGSGGSTTNIPAGPPSKKPVLTFAQKLKQTADAEAAAAAQAAAEAAAQRLTEEANRRQVSLVSNFYKGHRTTDEDYAHEDSSPDEMDYETALEYEEHLRYNRRERTRITDYSKDLSSEEEEQDI